ncbi:MAG: ABC transporter permease subunit, partial [Saprospiraceae bacterium]|nr:ABC transporter permease subunit [Saprospiraceae bacterium]
LLTMGENPVFPSYILPQPGKVLSAFGDLYADNDIIRNTCLSLGLNLAGYVEAILIALPLGFVIGLLPVFRGAFQWQVDAIRYVPLTAVTGLFIVWFGTGTSMKVHFLAFGILIYILPVVVLRINEVKDVFLKTVYTLGANDWQTIKTVYIPSVLSRISDDIRVLTAISWTYIIVAESIDNTGGIGGLIWRVGIRQGRVDKVFAMLLIIILIGILQDRIFVAIDRKLFAFKYKARAPHEVEKSASLFDLILGYLRNSGMYVLMGIYALLLIDSFAPILGSQSLLPYLFGETCWAIHLIMLSVIVYTVVNWYTDRRDAMEYNESRSKIAAADGA